MTSNGHGATGFFNLSSSWLSAIDFNRTLNEISSKTMSDKMVVYMEGILFN